VADCFGGTQWKKNGGGADREKEGEQKKEGKIRVLPQKTRV
jgi:hypothetical protein